MLKIPSITVYFQSWIVFSPSFKLIVCYFSKYLLSEAAFFAQLDGWIIIECRQPQGLIVLYLYIKLLYCFQYNWDQCRLKDLYKEDIRTYKKQSQHILNDPKTWEEVWVSFHFVWQPLVLYDNPCHFVWQSFLPMWAQRLHYLNGFLI